MLNPSEVAVSVLELVLPAAFSKKKRHSPARSPLWARWKMTVVCLAATAIGYLRYLKQDAWPGRNSVVLGQSLSKTRAWR